MRLVAGEGFAVFVWLLVQAGSAHALFQVIIGIDTKLFVRFHQHRFLIRPVGVMTGETVAILGRLMFYFGLLQEIVMASEAKLGPFFDQQFLVRRFMRLVAA